jgi:hypothetical protein
MRPCAMAAVVSLMLIAGGGGCAQQPAPLVHCGIDGGTVDPTLCSGAQVCAWLHLGKSSDYFCVLPCGSEGECPGGMTCDPGGASGCTTCSNLVDVCRRASGWPDLP